MAFKAGTIVKNLVTVYGEVVEYNPQLTNQEPTKNPGQSGAPGARIGEQVEIPPGFTGEVLSSDDFTTYAIYPIHSTGELEPHLIKVHSMTADFKEAVRHNPFIWNGKKKKDPGRPMTAAKWAKIADVQFNNETGKFFDPDADDFIIKPLGDLSLQRVYGDDDPSFEQTIYNYDFDPEYMVMIQNEYERWEAKGDPTRPPKSGRHKMTFYYGGYVRKVPTSDSGLEAIDDEWRVIEREMRTKKNTLEDIPIARTYMDGNVMVQEELTNISEMSYYYEDLPGWMDGPQAGLDAGGKPRAFDAFSSLKTAGDYDDENYDIEALMEYVSEIEDDSMRELAEMFFDEGDYDKVNNIIEENFRARNELWTEKGRAFNQTLQQRAEEQGLDYQDKDVEDTLYRDLLFEENERKKRHQQMLDKWQPLSSTRGLTEEQINDPETYRQLIAQAYIAASEKDSLKLKQILEPLAWSRYPDFDPESYKIAEKLAVIHRLAGGLRSNPAPTEMMSMFLWKKIDQEIRELMGEDPFEVRGPAWELEDYDAKERKKRLDRHKPADGKLKWTSSVDWDDIADRDHRGVLRVALNKAINDHLIRKNLRWSKIKEAKIEFILEDEWREQKEFAIADISPDGSATRIGEIHTHRMLDGGTYIEWLTINDSGSKRVLLPVLRLIKETFPPPFKADFENVELYKMINRIAPDLLSPDTTVTFQDESTQTPHPYTLKRLRPDRTFKWTKTCWQKEAANIEFIQRIGDSFTIYGNGEPWGEINLREDPYNSGGTYVAWLEVFDGAPRNGLLSILRQLEKDFPAPFTAHFQNGELFRTIQSIAPGLLSNRSTLTDYPDEYMHKLRPNRKMAAFEDPLDEAGLREVIDQQEVPWWKMDRTKREQAVANALRVGMLSPLKLLKFNAVHYQDISKIPGDETDPNVYIEQLKQSKAKWDARGQLDLFSNPEEVDPFDPTNSEAYAGFIHKHLQYIANVSAHIQELTDAAESDIMQGGEGQVWRNAIKAVDLPGVNHKVSAYAWLLLAPKTSELGTIDSHMMRALEADERMSQDPQGYEQLENELRLAKDQLGYREMPLGMFQWGLWDYMRTPPVDGVYNHQSHAAMKVLDPLDYKQVQWHQPINNSPIYGQRVRDDLEWWEMTKEERLRARAEYEASRRPRNQVAPAPAIAEQQLF